MLVREQRRLGKQQRAEGSPGCARRLLPFKPLPPTGWCTPVCECQSCTTFVERKLLLPCLEGPWSPANYFFQIFENLKGKDFSVGKARRPISKVPLPTVPAPGSCPAGAGEGGRVGLSWLLGLPGVFRQRPPATRPGPLGCPAFHLLPSWALCSF